MKTKYQHIADEAAKVPQILDWEFVQELKKNRAPITGKVCMMCDGRGYYEVFSSPEDSESIVCVCEKGKEIESSL